MMMHVLSATSRDGGETAVSDSFVPSPAGSLFLVCPFCQLENFIGKQAGAVYFLTAPAAVFHIYDDDFFEPVTHFIEQENISHVYVVADTSCLFVNNVLKDEKKYDIDCEDFIRQLVSDEDTHYSLTEKVLKEEIRLLRRKKVFDERITSGKLRVYGLLTNKAEATVTVIHA